jgi:hypothetical protein
VAGFVDGEGSFNVPIRRLRGDVLPYRVSLSFNVSQLGSEEPNLLRSVFDVGTVRGRGDGVYYFEVTTVTDSSNGSFRSSTDSYYVAQSVTTSNGSVVSLRSSSQVDIYHQTALKRSSL